MKNRQRTIQSSITVCGRGLHTGNQVSLTFIPASENHGYKFQRTDLDGQPIIPASIEYVSETARGTTLLYNGIRIQTVEHVLAAIYGLGIDNILIQIDNSEIPILDGSSKFFTEALIKAGIVVQDADKVYYELDTHISYTDSVNNIEIIAIPSNELKISVMVDYDTHVLSSQNAYLNNMDDFQTEIAPCRTFVFLHELEQLVKHNLIKGGDFENAIVFVDKLLSESEIKHLRKIFNKPDVKVLKEGVLNNVDLYFQNEPARHKLLDVIGDLALIGVPLKAHIIAKRTGHASNVHFVKLLKNHLQYSKSIKHVPVHLNGQPPLYNDDDIQKIIPQKRSFRFVDKIVEMDKEQIIGVKDISENEPFYEAYFDNRRMMPGVLLIEAIAQTGSILALNNLPDPENYRTYLAKINNVKFTDKVLPGSTLVIVVSPLQDININTTSIKGTVFVNDNVVAEAEIHLETQRED